MRSRLSMFWPRQVQITTWLAWLLPVFAWAPLTYPGYFEVQSGFAPVFNVNRLARIGEPAWGPAFGRAYDFWRGDGPLSYLLASLIRRLGAPGDVAVKLLMAASILAGALGVYAWARRRLGTWPGLLAAFVYALWPAGLATIYVRGAFAEAILLGIMPLVLWAADAALAGGGKRAAGLLGASLAAAFWTQPGLALWLSAGLLAYLIVAGRLRTNAGAAWLAGLCAGIAGLAPAWLERGPGGRGYPVFAEHFAKPSELFAAGASAADAAIPGAFGDAAFPLGWIACGLALLGLFLWRPAGAGRPVPDGEASATIAAAPVFPVFIRLAALMVAVPVVLSTPVAAPLWRLLPFLSRSLTYPWQLLLLAGPWLAWLAGLGGKALWELWPAQERSTGSAPLFAGLLAVTLLGSYGLLNPVTTPVPVPEEPVAVFGDQEIALLDTAVSGLPRPGGAITVTVHWQALAAPADDYTVFFQAIDADGKLWGQQDTMPRGGELPTGRWRPGQVIADDYRLALAADAPADADFRYLLGLYRWQTGERLRTETDDKVVLSP